MSASVQQRNFAARLRAPQRAALPEGLPPDRVAVYERLFYQSIESFVRGTFPVLHSLIPAPRWRMLVTDFIAEHHCRSPYFLEIGQEFIQWLQQGYRAQADDPPYLLELAHYEWLELALDTASAELPDAPEQGRTLGLQSRVQVSPLVCAQAYQWPVHQIGQNFQPQSMPDQATCLLVWRDRQDKVRFMQLTTFTYRLLTELDQGQQRIDELLAQVAVQCGLTCDGALLSNGLQLLNAWLADDILLLGEASLS
ncbi:HvfC family RiPP maturation protein [Halopseudomonas sp.]|uniref:HvfC family RiPP maturation protein n=1 Tax=Halopseudomonas sp. TaxID=2901191 RepID=UPI003001DAAE